jgi:hypothetical protein
MMWSRITSVRFAMIIHFTYSSLSYIVYLVVIGDYHGARKRGDEKRVTARGGDIGSI